jgi:hypothetical protein
VYFDTFEEKYSKFEEDFVVYMYDVNAFAPKLKEIYETIALLEQKNSSLPLRWHISKRKMTLPSIDSTGQYALEYWLSKWLHKSHFTTRDPEKALAFFVDIRCTSLKNTQQKRLPAQRVTQFYIRELIQNLATHMPAYTQRLNYLDHFYLCSHDMGVECTRSSSLEFRTNAIGIIHTADFHGKDSNNQTWNTFRDIRPDGQGGLIYNAHRDVTAPPYIYLPNAKIEMKKFSDCKYLAMFLGFNKGRETRQKIFTLFANHSDFLLGTVHGDEYANAFARSKFCLVVRGLVTSTLRFSEVFIYSCIPVVISDGYVPPFSGSINWNAFSIFVPERNIAQLPEILGSISEEKWNTMNSNLQKVRKHFIYNDPPVKGDAFHMILYEVWNKVVRFTRESTPEIK